ncbi:hypothetical protein Q3G72_035207 [Acer saccharum]|nr:hypothetical protein Q3G72_035207 [Acer saccharum]
MEERERNFGQPKEATSAKPVGVAWATWDQRGPLAVGPTAPTWLGQAWPLGLACSSAHPHVLQPYLRHPNSDFKSVFGLLTCLCEIETGVGRDDRRQGHGGDGIGVDRTVGRQGSGWDGGGSGG